MRLGSKIALVTGAGGGLGGATAIRFATEGAKVVCSDIDLAKAEKTVSIIESRGGTAIAHTNAILQTPLNVMLRLRRQSLASTD